MRSAPVANPGTNPDHPPLLLPGGISEYSPRLLCGDKRQLAVSSSPIQRLPQTPFQTQIN